MLRMLLKSVAYGWLAKQSVKIFNRTRQPQVQHVRDEQSIRSD